MLFKPSDGTQKIEFFNDDPDNSADIGGQWLCMNRSYRSISGGTVVPPLGFAVIDAPSTLNLSDQDVAYYRDSSFFNSSSAIDYVKWGSPLFNRTSEAVSGGKWADASDTIDPATVPTAQSIQYIGDGSFPHQSSDWIVAEPTMGQANQPPSTSLIGDFDGNDEVGLSDFVLFLDAFGTTTDSANWDPKFDLDGNGEIGLSDFVIFLDNFGKTG